MTPTAVSTRLRRGRDGDASPRSLDDYYGFARGFAFSRTVVSSSWELDRTVAATISDSCRYKVDGTLDASFGSGGIVGPRSHRRGFASGVALQADGRTRGRRAGRGRHHALRARSLLSDGSVDSELRGAGNGQHPDWSRRASVCGADPTRRKIVAVGDAYNGGRVDFAAARYNGDGTPDPTFGYNGLGTVETSLGSFSQHGLAAAIEPDGTLLQRERGRRMASITRSPSSATSATSAGTAFCVIASNATTGTSSPVTAVRPPVSSKAAALRPSAGAGPPRPPRRKPPAQGFGPRHLGSSRVEMAQGERHLHPRFRRSDAGERLRALRVRHRSVTARACSHPRGRPLRRQALLACEQARLQVQSASSDARRRASGFAQERRGGPGPDRPQRQRRRARSPCAPVRRVSRSPCSSSASTEASAGRPPTAILARTGTASSRADAD